MSTPVMFTLGIDPGSIRCGYAVICDNARFNPKLLQAGFFAMSPRRPLIDRVRELLAGLADLCHEIGPTPWLNLSIEAAFANERNLRTSLVIAQIRGAIIGHVLSSAEVNCVEVFEPAPKLIKRWMTGDGNAGKADMQLAAQRECRLKELPEPHDMADAIGLGLYGQHMAWVNFKATNRKGA